jgi:glutathione S-transferase
VDMMRLKELNPTGQLPVLLVGDEKVPDSTQILHRIEAMAPGSLTGGLDARARRPPARRTRCVWSPR